MSCEATFEALLDLGRAADYSRIEAVPGAGAHQMVVRFASEVRDSIRLQIGSLSNSDRVAFAKALAVYEDSVGGLGSVTTLQHILPLISDDNGELMDWILSRTRSCRHYSYGAQSNVELQAARAAHARRRIENEAREAERRRAAKARKAEQASAKLFNAVRRGDSKAVEALLRQGANPNGVTPDGIPLVKLAERSGQHVIAQLLNCPSGKSISD